ncbi:hypothetical protein CR513_27573, partial [Mucuna pruriens]
MEDNESIVNYFDRIQELVNAMRTCKEKVTDQQVESKDLDTMEVEELQHSLEVHEMRARTNYKGKVLGKGINPAPIRNTKIKNLMKLVSLLKEGGQTKHRSKAAAPKTARNGKEGAKNKPNNRAHLAQDEGTDSDSEAVMLLAITSNEAQPRITIEEEEKELIATPVFNKVFAVRRPLQLRDQELFQDSTVNLEGELIHSKLKPVEFETAVTEEKWLKAMKEEINSIEKNQTWEL